MRSPGAVVVVLLLAACPATPSAPAATEETPEWLKKKPAAPGSKSKGGLYALKADPAATEAVAPPPATTAVGLFHKVMSQNADGDDLARFLVVADSADTKVTYAHLKKNAAKHVGAPWTFTGRVLEISETADGKTTARVGLDAYGGEAILVSAEFLTSFVERDRVDVGGILADDFSYTSQAGWNITIPALMARSIQKAGTHRKLRKSPAYKQARAQMKE